MAGGGGGPRHRPFRGAWQCDLRPAICRKLLCAIVLWACSEHLNPELPGLGEWLRSESAVFTRTAWLSRMGGGFLGRALVITLPGSLQAVKECFGIFIEGLPKAIMMIEKQGRKGRL